MKKMKKQILKMSMKAKIICAICVVAMVIGAIAYNLSGLNANAEAVEKDKTYLTDIVDRIAEGKQKYFTILEVVPYDGVGEFRYFTGEDEVAAGILNKSQDELKKLFQKCSNQTANQWQKLQYLYSNFNYYIKYNSYQNTYEIKCDEIFSNYVLIEPFTSLLEGKVRVKTVEANKLTEEDIDGADLIILSVTPQDNSTISCYNFYNGATIDDNTQLNKTNVYDKSGNELNYSQITYETYEKVDDKLVSRDISWEMARKLLDYMEVGRDLRGDGTYTQTPVILDGRLSEQSSHDSNMYKLSLIYRMIESNQYDDFINNHITLNDADGNRYLTKTGALSAALYYEDEAATTVPQTTTPAETEEETSVDETETETETETEEETTVVIPSNVVRLNEFTNIEILKCLDANGCIDSNPNAKKRITNDYWVHNGDARIIPANLEHTVSESQYAGIDERGLSGKTVADVIRYLLGCKDSYTPSYSYGKITMLEVEPCNSFKYDNFEKIKELAKSMGIDVSAWTGTNYTKYFEVTCVSTKTLNCITTDLISTYDIVFIGDEVGLMTTVTAEDSNKNFYKKPIYNDSNLDGYIYLAYGDLTKLSSTLMGWLPREFGKYTKGTSASGSDTKISSTTDNAYIITADSYPTDSRYTTYNWNGTNFAGGDNKNLYHQLKYNQVYTIQQGTKNVWTDYQWEGLSAKYNSGTILGVIDTAEYYKNKANNSTDMKTVFNDPIGNARFSDNDITGKTMKALIDYADSGKLMVFCDSVYENDGAKLYPTSHMAGLMNYVNAPGSKANSLRETNLSGFITHINAMSPKLNFSQTPTPISYVKNTSGDSVIKMPTTSDHTLQYAFTIDAYANTQYKIKLIIDKDGNGVFADTGMVVTDDSNEIFKTMLVTTDASGHANVSFKTTLQDNWNGLVAYKVEVAEMNGAVETTLRSSYIGYTAVVGTENKEVKVLQIIPYSQYQENRTLALNMLYKRDGSDIDFNSFSEFKKKLFSIDGQVGYDIQVETMYTYDFESKFTASNPYVEGESYNTSVDYLNSNFYDMVVLGFGDIYLGDDISNIHGALDCIKDYIANGNSVMFAHDTMSFNASYNYVALQGLSKIDTSNVEGTHIASISKTSNRIKSNGKTSHVDNDKMCTNTTIELRNSVGMDRYGVTLSSSDRDGKGQPTYNSSLKMDYSKQSADGNYYVEEIQGLSDWVLMRQGLLTTYKTDKSSNGLYLVKPFNDTGNLLTEGTTCWWTVGNVEKVNEGQITMFPYKMDDKISVAQTHAQYYQLDMEDEDLVVWYTLQRDSGYYNITRKDGQNNYYIYSKGNVTYTGAGHTTIGGSDELKLFVNTIIKAIDSANTTPEVVVTNGGLGSGYYNIYASLGDSLKLKFKASDPDLTTLEAVDGVYENLGRFDSGRVIWDKDHDGQYTEGIDVVIEQYNSTNRLYNDIIYTIELDSCPAISGEDRNTFNNQVATSGAYFIIEATDSKNATGVAKAKITTRDLFNLD